MKGNGILLAVLIICFFPAVTFAEGTGENIRSLQSVLADLYKEMMPMCEQLIDVSRGIAGFAALFYIGYRVWRHIANAEAIDFFPLFRPFVLAFCIGIFPDVLGLLYGVLQPITEGTQKMVDKSNVAVKNLLKAKQDVMKSTDEWKMYLGQSNDGDKDAWYRYTYKEDPEDEGVIHAVVSRVQFEIAKAGYKFQSRVKEWMSEILTILFEAAALCINTLRTFQLVVLSILGPLVFGLACFDGLQHTLTAWISKYINIFLWLPVCNIFSAVIGRVQENLIKMDIEQLKNTGETFFGASDAGYIIFLIIGIVGYFTVPSVASFVVNAGGAGVMVQKVTSMVNNSPAMVMATASRAGSGAANIANMGRNFNEGLNGTSSTSSTSGTETVGRMLGSYGSYMSSKLRGGSDNEKK